MIYRAYILVDDGYFFDFETGKLKMSGGRRLDFGLMYACRLFADEMRGLALRINTITFSTLYSPELRSRAGRWDYLYCMVFGKAYNLFHEAASRLSDEMRLRLLNQTMPRPLGFHVSSIIRHRIPQQELVDTDYLYFYGEVPSLFREDLTRVLKLAMTDPNVNASFSAPYHPGGEGDLTELISILDQPWRIPTESELEHIARDMLTLHERLSQWERTWGAATREYWQVDHNDYRASCKAGKSMAKYRFSAASAAIHFLNSGCMRRNNNIHNVRDIILDEDHESVSNPECHIGGLLPFHHENPRLRVERRANLWRNLLLRGEGLILVEPWNWEDRVCHNKEGELAGNECSRAVAHWMAEASLGDILPSAFTLLLDGDPIPDRSADVFRDAIQRDAAWQKALEQSFKAPDDPQIKPSDDVLSYRTSGPFHSAGFPDLLKKLSEGQGAVRCNFDPGTPCSDTEVKAIMEANRGLPPDGWDDSCRWDHSFETCAPLPPFYQLLLDTVLPRRWDNGPPPSMRSWLGGNAEDEDVKRKTGGHSFRYLQLF